MKRETGVVVGASNLPSWKNVPLARLVQERTGKPVKRSLSSLGFLYDEAFLFSF